MGADDSVWRDPDGGPVGYGGVVVYSVVAQLLGVSLLVRHASLLSALIGVLLVAHARIVAAYLVHDAAHGAVFASARANKWLGVLCLWLSGALVHP